MVEVVAVIVEQRHADGAAGDEGVQDFAGQLDVDRRGALIRVVLADDAGVGDRVIGFADAREQQQMHAVEGERADQDEIRRLDIFLPGIIDIGDAGGFFAGAVEVDFGDIGVHAGGEILLQHQGRHHAGLRARLRVIAAAEEIAEAAIGALAHRDAERIGVRLRDIG